VPCGAAATLSLAILRCAHAIYLRRYRVGLDASCADPLSSWLLEQVSYTLGQSERRRHAMPGCSGGPFVAIIPARGGSKRLPGKNLRTLGGRPLLAYSILVARACPSIGGVYVTSDAEDILACARHWGALPITRPSQLATDESPTIAALQHAVSWLAERGVASPYVALLQPTCPLRRVHDIEKAIERFLAYDADAAVSVTTLHLKAGHLDQHGWYHPDYVPGTRKQDIAPIYQENGALYLLRRTLVERGQLFGARTLPLHLPRESGLASIDDEFDFQLTETLYHHLGYASEFQHLENRLAA